jgi:hypothetical protein
LIKPAFQQRFMRINFGALYRLTGCPLCVALNLLNGLAGIAGNPIVRRVVALRFRCLGNRVWSRAIDHIGLLR